MEALRLVSGLTRQGGTRDDRAADLYSCREPSSVVKAAEHAMAEGIRVCQLQGSGQWVATSGSQSGVAYELLVIGNVAHGCDCLAGMNGDPCCKHRAAFYLLIGALDLT